VTLAELNALARDEFVNTLGWVFEHSPWVAERTWPQRPFASLDAVHSAMIETMNAASEEERLTLLRAHPDLGARITMSTASTGEQAGAGLTQLAPAEFEQLQRLNADYRAKFGFPFLFAVKGSTPQQILESLRQRLPLEPATEFAEALRQVERIARFRLEEMITNE
jgi:2-oxo-4-hydroxy-4-carboxy-5-ureidoimidazoline decarboxylase